MQIGWLPCTVNEYELVFNPGIKQMSGAFLEPHSDVSPGSL